MHPRISTLIFFIAVIVIVISHPFPASAQKVIQCTPLKAVVSNDLEVKNDLQVDRDAAIANDATVNNDLRVNKDIYAASGSQKIYLGSDAASPYISNNLLNSGEGILFKSNGGDDFLWQSPSGTAPNAMILRSGGGLPNNNNYNLQVFGQVSSYQMHTQGIHLDMQGGIGGVPRPNILKFTNSAATGTGAAIFLGDPGAWDDNDLIFAQYTAGNDIGQIGIAIDAPSGNVGIRTVNPQITLAIGDNDTGLKWNSDGNFSLYTNNAERMKIDSAGDVTISNQLCLGGVCKNAWPVAVPETDPTVLASVKDGVAWGELSGIPAGFSDGVDDGLTVVAWGDVSAKPAICPIGQFVTDISAGTCAVPPAAAAEADTLNSVTGRGNTTVNAITVGGLTVDTNTLYVDSVNNRVGIGTLAPSYELDMGTANSRIRLQNPTAVLNSYITAGMENSTTKNFAVAVKDSLWVTQNAFIDGDLTVPGNTTLGDAATDITNVNGKIKITGGSPGAGKVLTSDSTGLAAWNGPATGSCSIKFHKSYSCVLTVNGINDYAVSCSGGEDHGECRGIWSGLAFNQQCSSWGGNGGWKVGYFNGAYVMQAMGKQNNSKSPGWCARSCQPGTNVDISGQEDCGTETITWP